MASMSDLDPPRAVDESFVEPVAVAVAEAWCTVISSGLAVALVEERPGRLCSIEDRRLGNDSIYRGSRIPEISLNIFLVA